MGERMSASATEWIIAGTGIGTNFPGPVEGRLQEVRGAEEVLALMDRMEEETWEPPIILVNEAGGTTLGPLMGEIRGVISTKGTLGAHIALLAKEYGCPCVVGVRFIRPPDGIETVRIAADGSVWARVER